MDSMPKYWLTQLKDDEWITTAMSLTEGGSMVQHDPRIIGTGLTPQAAMLRAITPLRERHPTAFEASRTLRKLLLTRGRALKDACLHLPISYEGLKRALAEGTESPDTYRIWARNLNISDADFNLVLRDIQRTLDFS